MVNTAGSPSRGAGLLTLILVFAAMLLSPLAAEDLQKTSSRTSDNAPISYTLYKHEYPHSGRTSFSLEIKTKHPHLTLNAQFYLRQEKFGMGRFPLRQLKRKNEDPTMRFGVQCLSDDFITESLIRVLVRDEGLEKNIAHLKIHLRDAIVPAGRSRHTDRASTIQKMITSHR